MPPAACFISGSAFVLVLRWRSNGVVEGGCRPRCIRSRSLTMTISEQRQIGANAGRQRSSHANGQPYRRHELGSSVEYHCLINQGFAIQVQQPALPTVRFGPSTFQKIEALHHRVRPERSDDNEGRRARRLEAGAADLLLICTTMHIMADALQASVHLPLLHIADPTAERVCEGVRDVISDFLGLEFNARAERVHSLIAE